MISPAGIAAARQSNVAKVIAATPCMNSWAGNPALSVEGRNLASRTRQSLTSGLDVAKPFEAAPEVGPELRPAGLGAPPVALRGLTYSLRIRTQTPRQLVDGIGDVVLVVQ